MDPWHHFALIPQVGNSTFIGFLALLVAVPASVYAARRTVPDGWRRRAMGAGEGILVLFTIGMALTAIGNQGDHADAASGVSYVQQGAGRADRERQADLESLRLRPERQAARRRLRLRPGRRPVSASPFRWTGRPSTATGGSTATGRWCRTSSRARCCSRSGATTGTSALRRRPAADGDHSAAVCTGPRRRPHRHIPAASSTAPPATHRPRPRRVRAHPRRATSPSTPASAGATGAQPTSALPSGPVPSNTAG